MHAELASKREALAELGRQHGVTRFPLISRRRCAADAGCASMEIARFGQDLHLAWVAMQITGIATRVNDAGQHAERQHIDLHDAERIDIVFVPFDKIAIFHCCRADRDNRVKPVTRQHETAGTLRQMAWKTE